MSSVIERAKADALQPPHCCSSIALGVGSVLLFVGGNAVSGNAAGLPPIAIDLRNTVTGEPLDLGVARTEGRDTPAVKRFLQSGKNLYVEDKSCLARGENLFLTACTGCHGQVGEGKIGPGLNDNYWTYPKNETDQGIFETVFGGARAQMGPHYGDLSLDDILLVTAWVRHLYTSPVEDAKWLSPEQKENYRPYKLGEKFPPGAPGLCASAAAKGIGAPQ